jgi:hypothetical protein
MAKSNRRELVMPDGTKYFGVEVDFEIVREDWSEYNLSDGGNLRVKNVLTRVYRLEDEAGNQVYGPDGEPLYYVYAGINIVTKRAEKA